MKWIKALGANFDNLSSTPEPLLVQGASWLLIGFWSPHTCCSTSLCYAYTHTQMKFLNITRMILQKSKRVEREAYISSLWKKKKKTRGKKASKSLVLQEMACSVQMQKNHVSRGKKKPWSCPAWNQMWINRKCWKSTSGSPTTSSAAGRIDEENWKEWSLPAVTVPPMRVCGYIYLYIYITIIFYFWSI